ncbi:MAG: hypothetical protein WAU70_12585 [Flavobacteriales bacterium]
MITPLQRRILIISLILVIMFCCTASAVLGLRSGHVARAGFTFFAGLTFSFLFWSGMPRKAR